jgi:hypothetical protein
MNCAQCQNAMEPQERFCSKCGRDSQPRVLRDVSRDWDTHVKVLAWIFIVSASFITVPGLSLLFFPGMMAVGHAFPHLPGAGSMFFTMALMFLSIPGAIICTGIGLLQYRSWARIVALILSGLMLIGFPFGTAAGIYGLWVLNSVNGRRYYKLRSAEASSPSPVTVP